MYLENRYGFAEPDTFGRRHPESDPPCRTLSGACRTGNKALVRTLLVTCTGQTSAGSNRVSPAGTPQASRRSLNRTASGSGSPELIPDDARELAIRVGSTHVAMAQVRAEAQQWTNAKHGACEPTVFRRWEEAMVAHVREELRASRRHRE